MIPRRRRSLDPRTQDAVARFRAAERALTSGRPDSPATLRALVILHTLRGGSTWLGLAVALAERSLDDPARWMRAACEAWVVRADPFGAWIREAVEHLPPGATGAADRLRAWRVTGRRALLDDALEALPATTLPALARAELLHLVWLATADEGLRAEAAALLPALGHLPLAAWPLAADLLDLALSDLPPVPEAPPEEVVPALAPLLLPPLELRVRHARPAELREGPVAEAITFPYAALRVRFAPHDGDHQVDFTPVTRQGVGETLDDVAVVSAMLEQVTTDLGLGALTL